MKTQHVLLMAGIFSAAMLGLQTASEASGSYYYLEQQADQRDTAGRITSTTINRYRSLDTSLDPSDQLSYTAICNYDHTAGFSRLTGEEYIYYELIDSGFTSPRIQTRYVSAYTYHGNTAVRANVRRKNYTLSASGVLELTYDGEFRYDTLNRLYTSIISYPKQQYTITTNYDPAFSYSRVLKVVVASGDSINTTEYVHITYAGGTQTFKSRVIRETALTTETTSYQYYPTGALQSLTGEAISTTNPLDRYGSAVFYDETGEVTGQNFWQSDIANGYRWSITYNYAYAGERHCY